MVVRITRTCEAIHAGIAQPVNAFSSFIFVLVAGYLIYYLLQTKKYILDTPLYSYLFIINVALIGITSFVAHATLTWWGGMMDFESMYLLVTLAILIGLAWLYPISKKSLITIWLLVNIPLTYAAGQSGRVTDYTFMGLIFVLIALEIVAMTKMKIKSSIYFWLALITMAIGYGIWQLDTLKIWCNPYSIWQGHSLWHLLTAVAAGLLYFYLVNKPVRQTINTPLS